MAIAGPPLLICQERNTMKILLAPDGSAYTEKRTRLLVDP